MMEIFIIINFLSATNSNGEVNFFHYAFNQIIRMEFTKGGERDSPLSAAGGSGPRPGAILSSHAVFFVIRVVVGPHRMKLH